MAREFPGSTSSKNINFGQQTSATTMSVFAAFYAISIDSTVRRIITIGITTTEVVQPMYISWVTSGGIQWVRGFGTTKGQWILNSQPSTGAWHNVLVTHDAVSTANDPLFYIDGSSAAFTEQVSPGGSTLNGAYTTTIGNTSDAAKNRCFEGYIAEVAWWDAILTAAEAASLGKGFSPAMIRPASLQFYTPLMGVFSPERDIVGGAAGTLTGSPNKVDHPRIIRPRRAY